MIILAAPPDTVNSRKEVGPADESKNSMYRGRDVS
jgi:hypothetical protein